MFAITITFFFLVLLKILSGQQEEINGCEDVCQDLPGDDTEPICMMLSRYKRGYEFFVNLCHARQTICTEKLVMEMVHPARCIKSKQFFRSIKK